LKVNQAPVGDHIIAAILRNLKPALKDPISVSEPGIAAMLPLTLAGIT
jgi:hypothetical protein